MQKFKAFAIECTINIILQPKLSHDTHIFMLKTEVQKENTRTIEKTDIEMGLVQKMRIKGRLHGLMRENRHQEAQTHHLHRSHLRFRAWCADRDGPRC